MSNKLIDFIKKISTAIRYFELENISVQTNRLD